MVEGKTILVTGGIGSIGTEIVIQILKKGPKQVRIYDNRETESFEMQHLLKEHDNLRFFIGDIRDRKRLRRAMEGVDIVFHCAALKHVPLCEYNPFEAVKTNVLGTQNIVDCALDWDIEKVVSVSTDKAVNPENTMGATKLLAERLVSSAQNYRGKKRTKFATIRFGNVMNSRGSVIPIFRKQVEGGGPVTITDEGMTRFLMSIPQAVHLVLKASELTQGGEIFILKMPVVRITDLAKALIEEHAEKQNINPDEIPISIIGARPGEKLWEELMTEEEAAHAWETDEVFIIPPHITTSPQHQLPVHAYPDAQKTEQLYYSSKSAPCLSVNEIKDIVKNL